MRESLIGKSIPRIDGKIKVTGKAVYCTDFRLEGELVGKILYAKHPHARIVRIDTEKALALDGVVAVVTAADAPDVRYGEQLFDMQVFARDKVRHLGDRVAAVAAFDEMTARKALELVEVEYEPLPAVFSPEEALVEGAPLIHPDLEDYQGAWNPIRYGNVCGDVRLERGDLDEGFAQADRVFVSEYTTRAMHQAYIEPHACVAGFDHNGTLTVWTGRQQLMVCHQHLARALDMPMNEVRVVPLWLGGGFGGKLKSHLEPVAALLALKAGKPVRLAMTREEEFYAAHPRAPYRIRLRTGVKNDGTLVAREVDILVDAGGYSDHALGAAIHAMSSAVAAYRVPHIRSRCRCVYTNNPDWGCMRGYGALQVNYATEMQMEEIAAVLGMDPIVLRRKNLIHDGDLKVSGEAYKNIHLDKTMTRALEISGYRAKKGNLPENRGIGLANMVFNVGLGASSAGVRANGDGSVSILTSIIDIGSGTHTALCQIAAEVLEIPVESVTIGVQDSENSPFDVGSFASRTVYEAGNAVRIAAERLKEMLVKAAAERIFKCSPEEVEWRNGAAYWGDDPGQQIGLIDLVNICQWTAPGPLIAYASFASVVPFETQPGERYDENPFASFACATHVAEVEVDPDTGAVKVLNIWACHDIGQVVNQAGAEGQVEGGVVQGVGYGLFEEMLVEDGRVLNPNFANYQIPTALDIPALMTEFIPSVDPIGPFGAKGIGEPPAIPPMPAIAAAIYDAVGVWVREIPITPEKLYHAMRVK